MIIVTGRPSSPDRKRSDPPEDFHKAEHYWNPEVPNASAVVSGFSETPELVARSFRDEPQP